VQVTTVVKTIIAKTKRLDSIVISIGSAQAGTIEDTTLQQWQDMQQVHLDGMFNCCKAAVPHLKKSKHANILIIGSVIGLVGKDNRLAYCTVKGAVANFTRAMALDLAGKIRVNSICPGWVKTDMSMKLVRATPEPTVTLRQRHLWHPMGRGGTPEEVASLAVFLLSDQAAWMTGQNIALDGGYTAR
jgi:meso-butanediol dehydrogenase/(S,S)-butanediol dehydrogenase/diacetyl reductase